MAPTLADARQGRGQDISFEQFDQNGDGVLSVADIEAARAERFAMIDADGNGSLSPEEFANQRGAARAARAGDRVEELDQNGDGLLSAEEMASAEPGERRGMRKGRRGGGDPMQRLVRLIERFDTDGDSALSEAEFDTAKAHMLERHGDKAWVVAAATGKAGQWQGCVMVALPPPCNGTESRIAQLDDTPHCRGCARRDGRGSACRLWRRRCTRGASPGGPAVATRIGFRDPDARRGTVPKPKMLLKKRCCGCGGSRRNGASERRKVSTWLYRVTSNLCTDRLRKSGRSRPLDDAGEPEDPTPGVVAALEAGDRARALQEALSALPDRQRQAVVMRHLDGCSNPEIAQAMDNERSRRWKV